MNEIKGWQRRQHLVRNGTHEERRRYLLTLEALKGADQGDVVSQPEMDGWAEQLDND